MHKVVFLNRRYCPGEAWTNRILGYAKGLAEQCVPVSLVYMLRGAEKDEINISGVQVVSLWEDEGMLAKKSKVISILRSFSLLNRIINYDDYIFVYGDSFYLLQASLLFKSNKIFCEVTEHPEIRGNSIKAKVFNYLGLHYIKKTDGLFVISDALKAYYQNHGVADSKVYKINMFVDTNRFNSHTAHHSCSYIAYCGAVSCEKDGVDILIKSFAKFHKRHRDYKLYIIGRGLNPSVIPNLTLLAKENDVEKDVIFTGAVPPEAIPDLLVNARILALARPQNLQAANGFPTKLGEYLATGNPVLVTSVGDIPKFIQNMYNGFLSRPGDIECFANQLSWIADHYEEAKIVGLRGKELSMDAFSYKTQSKLLYDYMTK